jgi:Fe-S-cluster containining protein
MPIEVTIEFIFRLAEHFDLKPEEAFEKYCDTIPIIRDLPYGNVLGVALKHPCPFFIDGCSIHKLKPHTCLAFPSALYLDDKAQSFFDYPCLNGEMNPPDKEEQDFFIELTNSFIENDGLKLNQRVLFRDRQPFIDIRDLKDKYIEIKKYLNESENSELTADNVTIYEKETEKIIELLMKELETKLQKKTIYFRIKKVDFKQMNIIKKLNGKYFEIRENFKK